MDTDKVSRVLVCAAVLTVAGAGATTHAGSPLSASTPDSTVPEPIPGAHDSPLPAFSSSTEITNPLFPLSSIPALVYTGEKEGLP